MIHLTVIWHMIWIQMVTENKQETDDIRSLLELKARYSVNCFKVYLHKISIYVLI